METNMGALMDIFNDYFFKGNKCIHEKKVLMNFGFVCKSFYKLYENKFNPKIKYNDVWEIFYKWAPTPFYYDFVFDGEKYIVNTVNCDFNVTQLRPLSMTCKALNNICGFGNCVEQCGLVCWKTTKINRMKPTINKNKFEHKMKEKYKNVDVINNIYKKNYGNTHHLSYYGDTGIYKIVYKKNYLPNLKSFALTLDNVKTKDIKTLVAHNYITEKQSLYIYKQFDKEMKYKVAQHKKNKIFDISLDIQNKNAHNKNNNKIFNTKRAYDKPVYQPMKR
jgi:hypothetical protein